jgi:hypothetical protein
VVTTAKLKILCIIGVYRRRIPHAPAEKNFFPGQTREVFTSNARGMAALPAMQTPQVAGAPPGVSKRQTLGCARRSQPVVLGPSVPPRRPIWYVGEDSMSHWLSDAIHFITRLNPLWTLPAGLVAFLLALTQLFDRFGRSRLIGPVDLSLPQIPDSPAIYGEFKEVERWIRGRQNDVEGLRKEIERNKLVFVYGPSGAGKSTLLKLGVCRALYSSGLWLPVYLDSWGDDWVDGPLNSLASFVQLAIEQGLTPNQQNVLSSGVNRHNVFEVLARVRSVSPRRPLLVFDQVDDYQTAHAEKFLDSETRRLITPEELQSRNEFWRNLAELLSRTTDGETHALFAIRTDAKHGLAPLRLTNPTSPSEYPVDLILASDAFSVIEDVIPCRLYSALRMALSS